MKSLITIAAAASILSSPVLAASKKPVADKKEVKTEATQQVAALAPSTATSASIPAAQAGVSTASLSEAKQDASERKISGELATLSVAGRDSILNQEGAIGSDVVLGVGYKLSENTSIGVRQLFKHSTGVPYDRSNSLSTFNMEDTYLHGSLSKIATFAGDGSISTKARLYLPTGESSRFTHKRNGAVRGYLIADKPMGKVDLSYTFYTQYNNHTQTKFSVDNPETPEIEEKNLADVVMVNAAELTYNFTDKLNITQGVGTTMEWGHNENSNELNLATTLKFAPIPELAISTALWNDINIYQPNEEFAIGRSSEISYVLSLEASI